MAGKTPLSSSIWYLTPGAQNWTQAYLPLSAQLRLPTAYVVMGTLEAEELSASRPPHPAPFKAVQVQPHAPYLPSMTVMTSFIWMCSLSGSSKS